MVPSVFFSYSKLSDFEYLDDAFLNEDLSKLPVFIERLSESVIMAEMHFTFSRRKMTLSDWVGSNPHHMFVF